MKFAASTIFLGLSVYLNSIGSICSGPVRAQHTYLRDMFPQSNFLHFPAIEKVPDERAHSYPNFKILNGRPMCKPSPSYVQRGRFIFGAIEGDHIESLGSSFDERNLSPVFDTEKHKWYTLYFGDLVKLGVSRNLKLVSGIDEVHAQLHERYHKVNPEAHEAASLAAYLKTRDYEAIVRNRKCVVSVTTGKPTLKVTESMPEDGVKLVQEHYEREYNKAYQIHAGGALGESSSKHASP